MKLAGGSPAFANELNVEAFLEQARSYEEATRASALGWYLRNAQTRALSHPLPVMRAREIDRWSQSAQYKALITKNRYYKGPPSGGAAAAAVSSSSLLPSATGAATSAASTSSAAALASAAALSSAGGAGDSPGGSGPSRI